MGKHHHHSKQLSLSDTKSMDYKSRKRIEELHLITDQILNRSNDMNYKYDNKLYRKYRQLKKINRRLQEKIINQHCSGCKCHEQLAEDTDESISISESYDSTNKENKKKISLKNSNQRTESSSEDETEEEQMDTTNQTIEEEEEGDSLSNLPLLLQDVIKQKVKQSKTDKNYLLNIGLYPELCELLCDTSHDSLQYTAIREAIHPFILKHRKIIGRNYMKILAGTANEIRDIHQSYMFEYYKDPQKKQSKANRKKEHQRKSL